VDSLTGKNSGNNSATRRRLCISSNREQDEIEVKLILQRWRLRKQEHSIFGAVHSDHLGGRPRLEGAANASLHAVFKHRTGRRPPVGVCIGSDRPRLRPGEGQLFGSSDDVNPIRAGQARSRNHGGAATSWAWVPWVSVQSFTDRVQDYRRKSAPCELLSYRCLRLLGISPLGGRLDATTGAIPVAVPRSFAGPVETHGARRGFTLTGREVVLTPPLRKRRCEP